MTGYGTLGSGSLLLSLWQRMKIQGRGIARIFHSTEHYEDAEDNMIRQKPT